MIGGGLHHPHHHRTAGPRTVQIVCRLIDVTKKLILQEGAVGGERVTVETEVEIVVETVVETGAGIVIETDLISRNGRLKKNIAARENINELLKKK